MSDLARLFATLGLAAFLSLLLSRLIMAVGLMDAPDAARKAAVGHNRVTPSSGGAGFIPAMFAALVAFSPSLTSADPALLALGAGVLASMALGLADDRLAMGPRTKLLLQIMIAAAMAWYGVRAEAIEPGFDKVRDFGLYGGLALSVLWIATLANAVNFMDGANGLAMGMAMSAAIGFCAVFGFSGMPQLALAAGALAGALGGFLVWNMPGRLFAGDAGSLAVGAALGGFSLMLVKERPDLVFVPPILVSPFLVDVILTLNLRIKRKEKFWEAHADHVYQVVLRAVPLEHWQLSIGHWMIAANCAALGFAAAMIGHEAPLAIFIGVVLMGAWMHIRIRRAAIAAAEERAAKEAGEAKVGV